MNKISRNKLRLHRGGRVRAKVSGTAKTPRLCVFRSLLAVKAQVIDDTQGKTLVAVGTKEAKVENNIAGAKAIGALIAKKCLEQKISNIVFDRSGYKYHGKVKALAEGAREGGLKF
ncbi:MAG TPA: 50S ribosomal protein L18 [Candidatus Moranbacteria bacterium]|nr:50S ribosomal protein L18 [Candidatus Moranbacteria bacterium]HAT74741.1 50S ribosomal protein L18 [Candidatus Moranbacteria bacterium]